MSLPPWVLVLMWIPSLALLAAIWIAGSPWLAIAGGIALVVLDVRVMLRIWRTRTRHRT